MWCYEVCTRIERRTRTRRHTRIQILSPLIHVSEAVATKYMVASYNVMYTLHAVIE